jgi:hypothetical protein
MDSGSRLHHYVPEWHLGLFSDEPDQRLDARPIWRYGKAASEYREIRVRHAAVQHDYYSFPRGEGAAPDRSLGLAQRQATVASSTGSANPLSVSERGSESRNRIAPSRLAVLTRISPPPASAPMRAAMWTPWPA